MFPRSWRCWCWGSAAWVSGGGWLGEETRMSWLRWIGRDAGYGRVPSDMVAQVEWLLMHRLEDLQGMFLLFVLVSAAGVIEGNARRQTVVLSGFGLRRLRAGRVLLLCGWAGGAVRGGAGGVALRLGGARPVGNAAAGDVHGRPRSAAGSLGGVMARLWMIGMLVGLVVCNPVLATADLFDDAVQALGVQNLEAASVDNLGRALKGGLVAGYPQYTPAPTVFHDFNISTPCGSFTFGTGLVDNLQAMLDPAAIIQGIQTTATNLIGAAISQLPMVSLCYAAPTMCDIVKYLQDMVNQILQFKGMSCQQAEQVLTGIGGRISGARTSRCISAQQRAGLTLTSGGSGLPGRVGGGHYGPRQRPGHHGFRQRRRLEAGRGLLDPGWRQPGDQGFCTRAPWRGGNQGGRVGGRAGRRGHPGAGQAHPRRVPGGTDDGVHGARERHHDGGDGRHAAGREAARRCRCRGSPCRTGFSTACTRSGRPIRPCTSNTSRSCRGCSRS